MKGREKGYLFALPRLLARLAGYQVRKAESSGAEVYSAGALVFGIVCVIAGRAFWPVVRPVWLQILFLAFLPLGAWIALSLLYYLNSLLARSLRALGLYSASTNNPLQHVIITSLLTLLAFWLIQDENLWLRSLGIFWCALVTLNLLALFILKLWHER